LIAGACFIIALITPAIASTSTSVEHPSDPEYTFGWQVAFSTPRLLVNAVAQRSRLKLVLSLMPLCAEGLLLAVVILELMPTLFAAETPGPARRRLAAILSIAALPPAILSLVMLRYDPRFINVPLGREVSASLACVFWVAAFFTLLLREWRPRSLV
jgi:hypothetical protein